RPDSASAFPPTSSPRPGRGCSAPPRSDLRRRPAGILSAMDERLLADDGCQLWTTHAGRGDPLVFCHGGPGMWDTFDDLAAMFAGSIRTIRWDQRGCGRSQRRGPYAVARSVRDLDAVRHQLAGARTALLGHSWGAYLALRYAIEHPGRVSHLI